MAFDEPLLSSKQVMAYLGYKSAGKFWAFVDSQGVPHIRIHARKIMFNADALECWIKRRTVGQTMPTPRLSA